MSRSKRLLRKLYFKENENSSSVACKNGSQMRSFSHTMSKNRIARWWRNLPPPLHQLCVVFQNSRKFHTHDVYSCFRVDGLFFFFFFYSINKILYPLTLFRIEIIIKYSQICFEWTRNNKTTQCHRSNNRKFHNTILVRCLISFLVLK